MINKKLLFLCFSMLFVFSANFIYADNNFVTVLNGTNITTDSSATSYSFVGQPVVFNTADDLNYVSKSAFASVLRSYKSSDIKFTDKTEQKIFTDINVPLKVDIESLSSSNIVKVKYQIWQGGDPDWDSVPGSETYTVYDETSGTGVPKYEFNETIAFTEGNTENYFRVYAELKNGNKSWFVGNKINISSSLADTIKFTSPDPLTNLASIDPLVETTDYSINLTPVTVTMYKGNNAVAGSEVYTIELSSTTNETYKMYDTTKGKISFTYSEFAKLYNANLPSGASEISTTLTQNATYTLELVSVNGTDTITFKALSGGVADILTYPSPFNPKKEKIKIRYLLGKESRVTIKLYDKAGKIVCKLVDNVNNKAGTNEVEWDGKNYAGDTLATGAYIVEIIAKASDGEHRRYTALAIVGK